MDCKTWNLIAQKYFNPLCTNRFFPDAATPSCPICVMPEGPPPTPCSELAFGEGKPWPIVEVAVPDIYFTDDIETWGDSLAFPFQTWSHMINPSHGNEARIGAMYGRLNELPWACEGVRTASDFQIFETSPGRAYQCAHQCHLQFYPNPPGFGDVLLRFEVSRTIGRYYPDGYEGPEWPIWGRLAASYILNRTSGFFPDTNPMPRTTLTASFEALTATLIHGNTVTSAQTGRRPGASGQGFNPAFSAQLPAPFTPPGSVNIKLVGF
jgi:hypothetical protein